MSSSREVQFGQRVASTGMSEMQKGHFLILGATGSGVSRGRFNLLMYRTRRKTTKDTSIKLMRAFRKVPYRNTTAPAS